MIVNPQGHDINPNKWGSKMWTMLHHISWLTDDCWDLIISLPSVLPCTNCRIHAEHYIFNHPFTIDPMDYLIAFHNAVTKRTIEGDVIKESFDRKGLRNQIKNVKHEIKKRMVSKEYHDLLRYQTDNYDDNNTWECMYLIASVYNGEPGYQKFYSELSRILDIDLKVDLKNRDTLFTSIYKVHKKDSEIYGYSIQPRSIMIRNVNELWDVPSITSCNCSPDI